jgi:phosphoserine aminotransferase
MELSHRSADFLDILARAKRDLTDLLQLPSNYHILFLTGIPECVIEMVKLYQ